MNRAIAWFVRNPIASNLLMLVLVIGGLAALSQSRREEFPNIDAGLISITVEVRGAAPEEVESTVCIRIEEAVEGTLGVDRISSTASEGSCRVTVDLLSGADGDRALAEIKNAVDSIDTFPAEAETPVVSQRVMEQDVIRIALIGNLDAYALKAIGDSLRNEVSDLPSVSQVDLLFTKPYEISIEVSEESLRRHGLSLGQVAEAVRRSSLDVPGGSVRTRGGEILLRTKGQAYRGIEFERVAVMTRADGTTLTLGEIGNVIDGFEPGKVSARANNQPTVVLDIRRVGEEDTIEAAQQVLAWAEEANNRLPEGVELVPYANAYRDLTARFSALLGSARSGLLLVLIVLGLFLRFRLALWVAAGVPISFLGALLCFPFLDITLNTPVIMSLILVLGILVDDAIVVGESVHSFEQKIDDPIEAAIAGTRAVYVPVVFGVLTTAAAFFPMLLIPGRMGQMFMYFGVTVNLSLFFSIIESHFILPAHLAHRRTKPRKTGKLGGAGSSWTRLQERLSEQLRRFAEETYRPALARAIEWRYTTLAIAMGVLVVAGGFVESGRQTFQFFPSIEGDVVRAKLKLQPGTPASFTADAIAQIEAAAKQLRKEMDKGREGDSVIRFIMSSVGMQAGRSGPGSEGSRAQNENVGEVVIELVPVGQRQLTSTQIKDRWRELTGRIPDALSLTFSAEGFGAGDPVAIRLRGDDIERLRHAAAEVRSQLGTYPGVFDVADSFQGGKQELVLELRPEARPLGLTLDDLGRQVRQAFFGEEVQRIQRGRDDVRVMVRYPEEQRRSLGDVEGMRIRTADGTEVPFASVARAKLGRGFASISRSGRQRVVDVTADVNRSITTPERVLAHMTLQLQTILPNYPGVSFSLEGEQRESSKAVSGLIPLGTLAIFVIYALLAIPLRSYVQPLIIMSVIPFGTVGALLGHLLMGANFTFTSVLGIVALSGVVVNSSLVLVHFVNRARDEGLDVFDAVMQAGTYRFRPIFLTAVTTFVGLVPLMFESDPGAFMVIPLAISLAFGVAFASIITLFVVPSLYVILNDALRLRESRKPAVAETMSADTNFKGPL